MYKYVENEAIDYDLQAALCENDHSEIVGEIDKVLLELTGENEGPTWHWIVKLKNGGHAYINGTCCYTGWD